MANSTANINLQNIGKRFTYEWIFKQVHFELSTGQSYAILGNNGSGKSTLLQIIAGSLLPSSGQVNYHIHQKKIPADQIFKYLSWAAPYIELIEEFSLEEIIRFQARFKPFLPTLTVTQIIELSQLNKSKHKPIRHYSSGMKQRAKLLLALLADTPILLLDEPTTNLDMEGVKWYHKMIENYALGRLLVIASNQEQEYQFCTHQLRVQDFKS